MNGQEWSEAEPPAWATRPLAWIACLINALPISVVVIAFGEWLLGAPSMAMRVGLFAAILGLWVWRFKPWTVASRPAFQRVDV